VDKLTYVTDSKLPCFAMFGENTAAQFRERFQLGLTTAAADAYMERLIVASIGSNWTRLYDSFQYYSYVGRWLPLFLLTHLQTGCSIKSVPRSSVVLAFASSPRRRSSYASCIVALVLALNFRER
jgi:hypothetical protein